MPTLLTLVLIVLLIPAGVAGISVGASELLNSAGDLAETIDHLAPGLASLLPYGQSLLCVLTGSALVVLAIGLIVRGLQCRV